MKSKASKASSLDGCFLDIADLSVLQPINVHSL
jgi:hypothetical protein